MVIDTNDLYKSDGSSPEKKSKHLFQKSNKDKTEKFKKNRSNYYKNMQPKGPVFRLAAGAN